MQRLAASFITFALLVSGLFARVSSTRSAMSPKDTVQYLWDMATQGALLTRDGWAKASALFVHPAPFPGDRAIDIVSNEWGPPGAIRVTSNVAQISVGFTEAGSIDSKLRYFPPKHRNALKTGMLFHLVLTPTHGLMFGPDGKTVIREIPGPKEWRIDEPEGLRWTTVNAAIRYVLEMRKASTDTAIRKNADETLTQLLRLH